MTVTLKLPPRKSKPNYLQDARAKGVSLPDYVMDTMIQHYQEDVEDIRTAEVRLSNPQTLIDVHQLRKNLGLND